MQCFLYRNPLRNLWEMHGRLSEKSIEEFLEESQNDFLKKAIEKFLNKFRKGFLMQFMHGCIRLFCEIPGKIPTEVPKVNNCIYPKRGFWKSPWRNFQIYMQRDFRRNSRKNSLKTWISVISDSEIVSRKRIFRINTLEGLLNESVK